ncbi:MAG: serpin family protein [Myxococcota bacterium]|jgi:serine protease inhibitor|nr:serpin family protein [Myxococcota bacterium]
MNARLAIALLLHTTLTGCPKAQVDDEYPASAPPVQAIDSAAARANNAFALALYAQLGDEPEDFVEVDESGSDAAAATAVVSKARSMIKHNSFVADQPFLFLIRERQSGAILFFGRVNEPS